MTKAVVLTEPRKIGLAELTLTDLGPEDVRVNVEFSGISTGTERLLYTGTMPPFPGLEYPLVPGYETVGTIIETGAECGLDVGDRVFVSGANCYAEARGLFGGAASEVVVAGSKVRTLSQPSSEDATLLALAATALHALRNGERTELPDLIIGHGVLGRLLARVALALGGDAPTVWEINPARRDGAVGYPVVDPAADTRADYLSVYDVSGANNIIDQVVPKMARGGQIVLAGFYTDRVSFEFPLAFMKEARLRIAAEWQPHDLTDVLALVENQTLDLGGLVTHREPASNAENAYKQAFGESDCLKMILDWRTTE